MPAARATSNSVMADQSLSRLAQIPHRIQHRSATGPAGPRHEYPPQSAAMRRAHRLEPPPSRKSDFAAPQSGQLQSSGDVVQRVPAAMPSSGQPSASSRIKSRIGYSGTVVVVRGLPSYLFENRPSRAPRSPGALVIGNLIPACAGWEAFPITVGLVVDVVTSRAPVGGHHARLRNGRVPSPTRRCRSNPVISPP